ncbi:glucosaminidase domain-containing protein [archaeon]|nr:glucosaminidase domain-containing protein [archaeon]
MVFRKLFRKKPQQPLTAEQTSKIAERKRKLKYRASAVAAGILLGSSLGLVRESGKLAEQGIAMADKARAESRQAEEKTRQFWQWYNSLPVNERLAFAKANYEKTKHLYELPKKTIEAKPSERKAGSVLLYGQPSISAETIDLILSRAGSPAKGLGSKFIEFSQAYGVDPSFVLAMFRKESNYGRLGKASENKSIGNIRQGRAGFKAYASWNAGLQDTFRLLAEGPRYIKKSNSTVEEIINIWAPSSENDSNKYTADVLKWMQDYQAIEKQFQPEKQQKAFLEEKQKQWQKQQAFKR